MAAELLSANNVEFEYEPIEIMLSKPYRSKIVSYERWGKQFKSVSSIRKISYTPDFIGDGWVMETKGKRTADFNLKWKLFRRYVETHKLDLILLMPTNKKEILKSIEIIKQLKNE